MNSTIYATWPLKKYHDVPLRIDKAQKNTITFYKMGISVATIKDGHTRDRIIVYLTMISEEIRNDWEKRFLRTGVGT